METDDFIFLIIIFSLILFFNLYIYTESIVMLCEEPEKNIVISSNEEKITQKDPIITQKEPVLVMTKKKIELENSNIHLT